MVAHPRFITAKHRPEEAVFTALVAAQRGLPFSRGLTLEERTCIALLAMAAPTHFLTLHARQLSRTELLSAWERLRKRLGRERGKQPLYYGCVVRAEGAKGWHLHVLLWEFIHTPVLHGHARALGLGAPRIEQVPNFAEDGHGALTVLSYVLGQQTPVFGNRAHRRHEGRLPGDHRFIKSRMTTFDKRRPEISAALRAAEDQAQSDLALCRRLPKFSRT